MARLSRRDAGVNPILARDRLAGWGWHFAIRQPETCLADSGHGTNHACPFAPKRVPPGPTLLTRTQMTTPGVRPVRMPLPPVKMAANPRPGAANPRPDEANPREDAANPREDAANPREDDANPREDEANPRSDAANPRPDVANPRPDAANPRPDAANPRPDDANPRPDAAHLAYPARWQRCAESWRQ